MDADVELLHRLVGDIDRFAALHWGQRSVLRPSREGFDDLLSVEEIERLLLTSARRPTFRLVRDGSTLPPERSTTSVRLGGQRLDDIADLARIATAVDEGATLVMQGLQRTSLTLARFCRSLERAVSHPVQANAYLTPGGSAGLGLHHDDHDVLVLQISGAKEWKVDDLGSVRTDAGDVLYIPAGVRHAAEAQHGASLHLTIGIVRITHAQALRRALDDLAADELSRPLPLGYARPENAAALAQDLRRTLTAAARAAADADVTVMAVTEQDRARRRRPLAVGQLQSILDLEGLNLSSRVARRPDHPAAIAPEPASDGRIILELVDRRLHLPAAMRPAVETLLTEPAVKVGALPGLDDGSKLVLARRLIRDGLLVSKDPRQPRA